MSQLTPELTKDFHALCEWTHHAWLMHKTIETSPQTDRLMQGRCKEFLGHMSRITQEYSLQQIAKLHDPALQGNNSNLSLDYVIRFGEWDESTVASLSGLRDEMTRIVGRSVKESRNNVLSHNDLETIQKEIVHGKFESGADERYFELLQQFLDIVNDKRFGGPAPFSGFALSDTQVFLEALVRGGAMKPF